MVFVREYVPMNGHWGVYRLTNQKLEIAKELVEADKAARAINILRERHVSRSEYDLIPLPYELEMVDGRSPWVRTFQLDQTRSNTTDQTKAS